MKIVHCADLHPMVLRNTIGDTSAFNRTELALNELRDNIKRIEPDVVVIAGDLYDSHNPDKVELLLINNFLTSILNLELYVLIIPGNHDTDDEAGKTAIDYLEAWERTTPNLKVALRNVRTIDIGSTEFVLYPWGRFPKKNDRMILGNSKYRIGVLHTDIDGSIIDDASRIIKSKVTAKQIKKYLNWLKIDYMLMGDIHEQQKISDRIIYSGSIYQTKFGARSRKGFGILDYEKGYKFKKLKKAEKLLTVNSLKDVGNKHYYRLIVESKDETIKMLNRDIPSNVIKVKYPITKQLQGTELTAKKINLNVSLVPIMIRILQKQGVKDIRGTMKYLIKHIKTKNDLILT